jgi:indolepyruvate ferredoxin oxidoreductase, alpha subunit
MSQMVLLGDEAVAIGAVHAGLTAAYAYPGTPSTEIMEYLLRLPRTPGGPLASWCINEKTAFEQALGVSFAGRRTMVVMKHVGLNVAADPFMNSALVGMRGGLVVAVADDPGMHSSQNEQDSRYYADFARVICLEPATQQEAYDMTREAFDLSERFRIPVMVRLVTRLAHSRSIVSTGEQREQNPVSKASGEPSWILLPANARRQWHDLLARQAGMRAYSEGCFHNKLDINMSDRSLGIITTGIARNYLRENLEDLGIVPSMLHIGAYPLPYDKIRSIAGHVKRVLVLEEGYPLLERFLRGIVPPPVEISGKESGEVPAEGELTPDVVRAALSLPRRRRMTPVSLPLPGRPPQLCAGCPHGDMYSALKEALAGYDRSVVTSDIGCYTLGALPPYSMIESCVCMGASVGMAKGASEAGLGPVVAVIGDSTFLHSGVTPLMDAIAANTDMTLLILDNEAVAMTGGQPTILPSSRLQRIVEGLGVEPEHFHVLPAHHRHAGTNSAVIRRELEHKGLSVIIAVRECIETAKQKKKERHRPQGALA